VELAKELADEKSPKFINGVLDAIGKEKAEVVIEDEKETVVIIEENKELEA
jgi:hypothetical protein